jgi:hypothetical protein
MWALALKNWRVLLAAAVFVAAWGTVVHMKNTIDDLREEVATAEKNEALARTAAAEERANADRLAFLLQRAQEDALDERRARDAAEAERDEALQASQQRSADRRETLIVERDIDPTLDMCLRYELPDSVVRQLPF